MAGYSCLLLVRYIVRLRGKRQSKKTLENLNFDPERAMHNVGTIRKVAAKMIRSSERIQVLCTGIRKKMFEGISVINKTFHLKRMSEMSCLRGAFVELVSSDSFHFAQPAGNSKVAIAIVQRGLANAPADNIVRFRDQRHIIELSHTKADNDMICYHIIVFVMLAVLAFRMRGLWD